MSQDVQNNNCTGSLNIVFFRRRIQVSQELRSLLRDLIPELILSQKSHTHMGPICDGLGVTSF